jgi:hypothetical protein
MNRAARRLGEALAILGPVAGCPDGEGRDYALIVLGRDGEAYIGASDRLTPDMLPALLRRIAGEMEAGQ